MLDSLKYAFAAITTALAGGYVVNQSIDAETPQRKPVQVPLQYASLVVGDQNLNRNVTLNINGTFGDVVKWLKSQKINFVIADESAAKRKIALNFDNRPLREVLNAIASAMGGTWNHQGDTMVFRSNSGFPFTSDYAPRGFDGKAYATPKWTEGQLKELKALENFKWDGGDFKMDGKLFEAPNAPYKMFFPEGKNPNVRIWIDGKEVKPEELKKKKLDGKDFQFFYGDGKMSDDLRKQIEEGRSHAMKNLEMYRDGKSRPMTDAERKEFDKAMKEAQQSMQEAMKHLDKAKIDKEIADAMKSSDMKNFKGLTDAQRKEVEDAMKTYRFHMNDLDKAKIDKEIAEAMKHRDHAIKNQHGLTDKQRKEIDELMKRSRAEMEKARQEMERARRIHVDNIRKLLDSLTPAQKDLAKKQGHLKLSDLTPEQRRLLDIQGNADDSMTLSYSIDGKSITIKGK